MILDKKTGRAHILSHELYMFPYGCQGKSLLFHFYYQSCKTSETLELEHSRGFFWKLPTILFLTANSPLFNMYEGYHYSQSNYLIVEYFFEA